MKFSIYSNPALPALTKSFHEVKEAWSFLLYKDLCSKIEFLDLRHEKIKLRENEGISHQHDLEEFS